MGVLSILDDLMLSTAPAIHIWFAAEICTKV
jgi:hypothetical protein